MKICQFCSEVYIIPHAVIVLTDAMTLFICHVCQFARTCVILDSNLDCQYRAHVDPERCDRYWNVLGDRLIVRGDSAS